MWSSLCTYTLEIFLWMLVCICVHVNVWTYVYMGVCVHAITPSYMFRFPLSSFIERQMGWRPTVITWLYVNHILKALSHSEVLGGWSFNMQWLPMDATPSIAHWLSFSGFDIKYTEDRSDPYAAIKLGFRRTHLGPGSETHPAGKLVLLMPLSFPIRTSGTNGKFDEHVQARVF